MDYVKKERELGYQQSRIPMIPYPKHLTLGDERYALAPFIQGGSGCEEQIAAFQNVFARMYGLDLTEGEGGILLEENKTLAEEAYRLEVTQQGATLTYATVFGLCAGFASILQLAAFSQEGLTLPRIQIDDYPDRNYRGLMIDLARKRHSVDSLYQLIDLCYFYKVRYLHLHFCDHEAFTLPTEVFPHLNETGWHYSKAMLNQVCAYARARGVILVPEIEIPGHATKLLEDPRSGIGSEPHSGTMCIAAPGALDKICALVREVCGLFPDAPYLHIGGDEVDTEEWEKCPLCHQFCREHDLPTMETLYSYFVGRMAGEVLACGKRPIVWEGFSADGAHFVPRETIVNVFENMYFLPQDLLAAGYDVINVSWKPYYMTPTEGWPSRDIYGWNPFHFGSAFSHSPAYPDPIRVPESEHVLGAQICSWECEFSYEFPILKKTIPALCERVWTVQDVYGSNDFQARLKELTDKINILWI